MPLDGHYASIVAELPPASLTAQEMAWEQVENWKATGIKPHEAMLLFGIRRFVGGWDRVLRQLEIESEQLLKDNADV